MKPFFIVFGAFLLGFLIAELQAFIGKCRIHIGNNLLWGAAFALIAAGLCM